MGGPKHPAWETGNGAVFELLELGNPWDCTEELLPGICPRFPKLWHRGKQECCDHHPGRSPSQEDVCFPGLKDFSPSSPSWLLRVTRAGISCELPVGLSSGACSPQQIQFLLMGVATVFLMILGMNPWGSGQEESRGAGQVTCVGWKDLGCSMWEHEGRWDEGCPAQQDVLDTGGHPSFKDGDT